MDANILYKLLVCCPSHFSSSRQGLLVCCPSHFSSSRQGLLVAKNPHHLMVMGAELLHRKLVLALAIALIRLGGAHERCIYCRSSTSGSCLTYQGLARMIVVLLMLVSFDVERRIRRCAEGTYIKIQRNSAFV